MAQTYIGSTLRTGSGTLTDAADGGFVVLTQSVLVTTVAAGTAVTGIETLPANSQIINFIIDQVVDEVAGAGTVTTINATLGTAPAGTQYLTATNVIAGGRVIPATFTAAQLVAMSDIGTNTNVYFTIAPNGTIVTTQGVYRLTLAYAQKV